MAALHRSDGERPIREIGVEPRCPDRAVRSGERDSEVLVLFAASVATFILVYGSFLTFLPFVLERTLGASALWIGVVMSAASAVTAVTAFHLGPLAQRFGERRLVKVGWLLYIGAKRTRPS